MKRPHPADRLTRRASDDAVGRVRWRQRFHWLERWWEPVAGGQLLLVVGGLVTTATVPLLHPDRHAWEVLAAVAAAMTMLLLLSLVLPWARLPARGALVFPVAIWLAVAVIGLQAPGIATPYLGLFTLGFTYIGLTQPAGTGVQVVPIAAAAYVTALGGWSPPLAPRLIIAVAIWLLISELLAELVGRQAVLTGELQRAALTDALTGLANRRDLDRRLRTARAGDTVVICDLDHFKQLNDTQGHAAGDAVLAEFGLMLRTCLRQQDYAARFGGEEFALLLPATGLRQAEAALTRLREHWKLLQTATFSSGVALCRADRSPEAALAAADRALYEAKAAGRDRDRVEQPAH